MLDVHAKGVGQAFVEVRDQRGPAGQHHTLDVDPAGFGAVVVDAVADLIDHAADPIAQQDRVGRGGARQDRLDRLGLLPRQIEGRGEGVGDVLAADADRADEPGGAAGVDGDVGQVGSDVDDHLAGAAVGAEALDGGDGIAQGADLGEGVEVQVDGAQLRGLHHVEGAGHHLGIGGYQEDAHHVGAVLVAVLLDELVVELHLLHRDGQVLAGLQVQALAEVVLGQQRQVDAADDDLLVGDAQRDLLALELEPLHEDAEGLLDPVWFLDDPVDDGT